MLGLGRHFRGHHLLLAIITALIAGPIVLRARASSVRSSVYCAAFMNAAAVLAGSINGGLPLPAPCHQRVAKITPDQLARPSKLEVGNNCLTAYQQNQHGVSVRCSSKAALACGSAAHAHVAA